MNILVYRWDIYPYDDIIQTLTEQGHFVDVLAFPISSRLEDSTFETVLTKKLNAGYDMVFSVNYYAVIATVCNSLNLPYASWTCDSPLLSLQHPSVFFPGNYIFLFDYKEYQALQQAGVPHAYYLPLAGIRLESGRAAFDTDHLEKSAYDYDISFIGNLYDRNRYDEMCCYLPDYLCGYMDAAIEAQKSISGGNLLPGMLSDEILADLSRYTKIINGTSSPNELRMHFATTVLSYKAAADTRTDALNFLALHHNVHLFTTSQGEQLERVTMHPAVDYHTEMPQVFHRSKINLNFTLPNIENGIPLRVFDVLASGGFLLTDYRAEICRQFKNGVDLVVFDGLADLNHKTDYYLSHPEERIQIARNGQKKVQQLHQYKDRLEKILHTVFPSLN